MLDPPETVDATRDRAVIGIDLGTTNSVIAAVVDDKVRILIDADGNQLHPSVVAFMPSGERLVGQRARARRAIDPANTIFSVKRIIGRPFRSAATTTVIRSLPYKVVEGANQEPMVVTRTGTLSVVDVAATVLIYLRQLAESQLVRAVTHCVITVPANFSDAQREATRQAVKRAGMTPLRLLNEPTAAALAYGTLQNINRRIAIFDLGGGTFDVTLLAVRHDLYEVIATGGDPFLGGDDMDHALADHLAQEFEDTHHIKLHPASEARARLVWAAEAIKKQLTVSEVARGSISDLGHGPGGQPLSLSFHITRALFEELAGLLIDRALDVSRDVLETAEVLPRQVDEVILVGGSTVVPLVQQQVARFFGRTPKVSINPMQVVAAGAAIHAASLMGGIRASADSVGPADLGVPSARSGAAPPGGEDDASTGEAGRTSGGDVGGLGSRLGAGLLMDVTSHSLGLATAGGYAEFLIPKNTPIPAEGTRIFRPARDGQTMISIKVCQGESRTFEDNVPLGEIQLSDLQAASRAEAKIEVSFLVDANGMLRVSARDLGTGRQEKASLSILGVAPGDDAEDSDTASRGRQGEITT